MNKQPTGCDIQLAFVRKFRGGGNFSRVKYTGKCSGANYVGKISPEECSRVCQGKIFRGLIFHGRIIQANVRGNRPGGCPVPNKGLQ